MKLYDEKILEDMAACLKSEPLTVAELASALGIQVRRAYRYLYELERRGEPISRMGMARRGAYTIRATTTSLEVGGNDESKS